MRATAPTSERRLALVWLALSAITILSWWLGSKHGPDSFVTSLPVTIGVIAIALLKVRFIMRDFMEARHAPADVRRLCDVWLLALTVGLLGTYLLPRLIGRPL
jgi:hypothetical protein